MDTREIREKYLKYFGKQRHAIVPSCGLVPDNDPSTLFTSAGMQQMIPYLLGEKHPLGTRVANSQKCLRTQDIEEVGDNRHTTFFEMLGNWSLNDYFKQEQLGWIFEFLTKEIGLDPQNLYITAFRGLPEAGIPKDSETVEIWKKLFALAGIDAKDSDGGKAIQKGERIFYYDEKKNWWSRSGVPSAMPEGELGGPDSEIFWDFGAGLKLHENSPWANQSCHVNCDCGRFLEIGNSVFMEYVKHGGKVEKMTTHNVDFGGGLERFTAASINNPDIFQIDIFRPIIKTIEELSGLKYGTDYKIDKNIRILADHIRSAVFLIVDGIIPSNKAQGYFVRRLIRRAMVKGSQLHIAKENYLSQIARSVYESYKGIYLLDGPKINAELGREEKKFDLTLVAGMRKEVKDAQENSGALNGVQLFDLFQSYGYPLEVSIDIATEKGIKIQDGSVETFNNKLKEHQDLSRTASAGMFRGGLADAGVQTTRLHTAAHLMLAALRQVLGDGVMQKGSNITAERLRFDFSYPSKMTPEQIKKVQDLVNEHIKLNVTVNMKEMSLEDAKACGAMGAFESKYGDRVKVYSIGDFSREICGGPHAQNTGELGRFKIVKEEASSAGVRRIKAVLD